MKEKLLYLNTDNEEELEKAIERTETVKQLIEMSKHWMLQDGFLKMQVGDLIIHVRFGYNEEDNQFILHQKHKIAERTFVV